MHSSLCTSCALRRVICDVSCVCACSCSVQTVTVGVGCVSGACSMLRACGAARTGQRYARAIQYLIYLVAVSCGHAVSAVVQAGTVSNTRGWGRELCQTANVSSKVGRSTGDRGRRLHGERGDGHGDIHAGAELTATFEYRRESDESIDHPQRRTVASASAFCQEFCAARCDGRARPGHRRVHRRGTTASSPVQRRTMPKCVLAPCRWAETSCASLLAGPQSGGWTAEVGRRRGSGGRGWSAERGPQAFAVAGVL